MNYIMELNYYDEKPAIVVKSRLGEHRYVTVNFGIQKKKGMWGCYSASFADEIPAETLIASLSNAEMLKHVSTTEMQAISATLDGNPRECMIALVDAKIEALDAECEEFWLDCSKWWFDKAERASLRALIEARRTCGEDRVTIWLGEDRVTMPLDDASLFLAKLEVYAGEVYCATAAHKQAIRGLKTAKEVAKYDYSTEYPEKIRIPF